MKPSQVAQALRHIASGIDKSKKPQKALVAKEIKKIISSLSKQAAGDVIVINVSSDGEYYNVTTTNEIVLNKPFVSVQLPTGELSFAMSLDDIKANMDMKNQKLLEALYNRGLINVDDEGEFIF